MIQALKKIRLNNNNILKFIKENESEKDHKIRMRIINTNALLDQMKITLNIEDNEVAVSVLETFDWLAEENDELYELSKIQPIDGENEESAEQKIEKKIETMNHIVKNIQEGFEGIE
jgi:hypothetical protein